MLIWKNKAALKNFMLFAIFAVSSLPVFAMKRSSQELILADSPIYDRATAIFLEAGLWNYADSSPVTIQEMKFYLSEIDYSSLSDAGKENYDSIFDWFEEEKLAFDSGIFSFGTEPVVSLEGYYKTNDDVAWIFDRYNRKPLLDMPIEMSFSDYGMIFCDVYLAQNRCLMERTKDYSYMNIPIKESECNLTFPTTAYFSTGKMFGEENGISFQLGMADRNVGRTFLGSSIMSDHLTGATYGQLSFFARKFKYTASISQLNVDRYFYTHKLEIRPVKKFAFTFLEGQLAAHSMELRFMNPLTIFHGFAPWREYSEEEDMYTCAFFAAKADFVPIKYLRIYGIFVQTQIQTPYEKSKWGDSVTPTAQGGQLGVESYLPIQKGFAHFGIEGYYAQPYLYLKPSPNASMVRTYRETLGDMDNIYEWIGSPFGPDSMAATFIAGYEMPNKWSVTVKYLVSAQGELSVKNWIFGDWGGEDLYPELKTPEEWAGKKWRGYPTTTKERDQSTPTGTPQYTHVVSIRGSCFLLNQQVEIIGQPSFVYVLNNNHKKNEKDISFEIAVSCRIKLWNGHKGKGTEKDEWKWD